MEARPGEGVARCRQLFMNEKAPGAWRAVLGWTLVAVLLLNVSSVLAHWVGAPPMLVVAFGTVVAMGGTAAWAERAIPGGRAWWRWGSCSRGHVVGATALGVGVGLVGTLLLLGTAALWPGGPELLAAREVVLAPLLRVDDARWIPVVVLVLALLPGVFEEGLYRGVLRHLLLTWSPTRRVLFLALCFAGAHLDVLGFVGLFVAGVAFGWLAERGGGVGLAIIGHVAMNAFNAVVLVRVATLPGVAERPGVLLVALGVAGVLLVTVGVRLIGGRGEMKRR